MGAHMDETLLQLRATKQGGEMTNKFAAQVAIDAYNEQTSFLPAKETVSDPVNQPEYTGGSVSYYRVEVPRPTSPNVHPYMAECNDIIEALQMNYAEGNAFKAIWRMCAARLGKSKKGYTDGLYDAEKVEFFGKRMVAQNQGEK